MCDADPSNTDRSDAEAMRTGATHTVTKQPFATEIEGSTERGNEISPNTEKGVGSDKKEARMVHFQIYISI